MKNVLIIAHLLKASPRIPGLARYLPEFGWQPVILTAPLEKSPDSKLRIVETEYRETLGFWKKVFKINPNEDEKIQIRERLGITSQGSLIDFLLTRVGEIVNYPDSDKGWKRFAIDAGSEVIAKEGIEAIISSSSPVTAHIIADELKAMHKIPWLADLRDLWSQNHNYGYSPLRKLIDERLELKTLSTADALITVSKPWAEQLSRLHKAKTTYSITNGFDPAEVNDPPANLTAKFTITYTGLIYPGKQDPSKFFAALQQLISASAVNPDEIEVRFYGPEMPWLLSQIEKYGLSDIVKCYGVVPQKIATEKQRESQILFLLNWEDLRTRGWHPLKGFEYLAAQRPILAVGGFGNDVTERLLEETKAGMYCKTVYEVKNALSKMYSEYKLSGKVGYNGDMKNISKYSHREIARKYSEILYHVTGGLP